MLYGKLNEDGTVNPNLITETELRDLHAPNVTLPAMLSADALEPLGWVMVPPYEGIIEQHHDKRPVWSVTKDEETNTYKRSYVYENYDEETAKARFERKLSENRQKRDLLLFQSDWTQVNDAPLTEEQKTAWAEYRQALRDITAVADPYHAQWPQKP